MDSRLHGNDEAGKFCQRTFALVFLAVFIGCAGRRPAYLSQDFNAKASPRVAVLPLENESVDLLAPAELQTMIFNGVKRLGYNPLVIGTVQQKLKEVGITDGGQLRAIAPQKLGEVLRVDGLFYGTIEDFVFQNLGFVLRRAVRLRLKLVLASTGEALWEDGGEATTVNIATNQKDAKRLFAVGMAQRTVENMASRPLWLESQAAVQNLMMKLPPPNPRPIIIPIPVPPPAAMPLPSGPPAPPVTPNPPIAPTVPAPPAPSPLAH